MDESRLIDWYDVAEQVANGRVTGHACPECGASPLACQTEGGVVRLRCPGCGQGIEGRLGSGRDDALYAEEAARRAAKVLQTGPATSITEVQAPRLAPAPVAAPTPQRSDWQWKLPSTRSGDLDGLALWSGVVEAVHNGRLTGLRCPYCSEPLSELQAEAPYVRVRCTVCGEGFEGKVE